MTMRRLWLKKDEERRVRAGHLWIFSNEVDVVKSPLADFAPGETATLCDCRGRSLGSVSVSPGGLICARIHSREAGTELSDALLHERLATALALRKRLFAEPFYRLCHGEGDFLPGLVIDRYDAHLSLQITTPAMENRKEAICRVLDALCAPSSIVFDNDLPARRLEGLNPEREIRGAVPETLDVPENGCRFATPCLSGQKTGWFFDQRANRAFFASCARGGDVLDVFCYTGGFGVTAAKGGARSVTFLDASADALGFASRNLAANAPTLADAGRAETICGDAFHELAKLREAGRRFSLINLDPPAFIKRRKDAGQGMAAYSKLNALAAGLLTPGGFLASSSCSYHLPAEDLRICVARAAAGAGLHARLLHVGGQGPDHPIHAAMPETAYLKCLIAQMG